MYTYCQNLPNNTTRGASSHCVSRTILTSNPVKMPGPSFEKVSGKGTGDGNKGTCSDSAEEGVAFNAALCSATVLLFRNLCWEFFFRNSAVSVVAQLGVVWWSDGDGGLVLALFVATCWAACIAFGLHPESQD